MDEWPAWHVDVRWLPHETKKINVGRCWPKDAVMETFKMTWAKWPRSRRCCRLGPGWVCDFCRLSFLGSCFVSDDDADGFVAELSAGTEPNRRLRFGSIRDTVPSIRFFAGAGGSDDRFDPPHARLEAWSGSPETSPNTTRQIGRLGLLGPFAGRNRVWPPHEERQTRRCESW